MEVRLGDAGDVDSSAVDWDDGAIFGLEDADVGLSIVLVDQRDAGSWDAGDGHGEIGIVGDQLRGAGDSVLVHAVDEGGLDVGVIVAAEDGGGTTLDGDAAALASVDSCDEAGDGEDDGGE